MSRPYRLCFRHAATPVGVGVPDDPSGKSDLDGPIFPHTELPPDGGRDVGDAIPYGWDVDFGKFHNSFDYPVKMGYYMLEIMSIWRNGPWN